MNFQYILNSKSLLVNKQKNSLYKIKKKSVYLLLAVLFINSVLAIEADDIHNTPSLQYPPGTNYPYLTEPATKANCAPYINLATTPTQQAFDYDPSMLPEVAEVIFVLRIKHANIGEPFIINLSGNYLLKFTKDRIHILDMYTKKSDVYEYQSTNPNITLGLSISKGLPRNYKGIIIKEDAHGQLYDYAALRSDNISTDETMLSETLSHPFYQIAGKDGVNNKVKVTKAMAFYQKELSHSRHARCVKESMGLLEQIQQILWSGSLVCGPEAASGIHSANHQSATEMKLDQPLVEATVNTSKYPERLGYRLLKRLDLNGKDPETLLAAANRCGVSVMTIVKDHRKKRASPDLANCRHWVYHMMELYISLDLKFSDIYQIVESVKQNNDIPASYFPGGQYPPGKEGDRAALVRIILGQSGQAAAVLQIVAAESGEAAGASSFVEYPAGSQAGSQSTAAEGGVEIFILNGQQFKPQPNKVRKRYRLSQRSFQIAELDGTQYTSRVIYLGDNEQRADPNIDSIISDYQKIVDNWISTINKKLKITSKYKRVSIRQSRDIAAAISSAISEWEHHQNMVISAVYHNGFLIGISIGRVNGRTYYPELEVATPTSIFGDHESYVGQIEYLRSAVLKYLLSKGLIDSSELVMITSYSTGHDEL